MLYRIADLIVDFSDEGNVAPLCKPYQINEDLSPDIKIRGNRFDPARFPGLDPELIPYMTTGEQFYYQLLRFSGMLLHSSAVAYQGHAYLFSGKCGAGKSTHTQLWQKHFGEDAVVFNDDKPALRLIDGTWYAYGTPWCGSSYINVNMRVPIAGICFLTQSDHNAIRRLSAKEAVKSIFMQTMFRLDPRSMDALLTTMDALVRQIPVFELENKPEEAAAILSYETMSKFAKGEHI